MKFMQPVHTEDFALDAAPRPFWLGLRDLATSVVLVAVIAMIVNLLGAR